jgi:transposase
MPTRRPYSTDLSDEEWEILEPLVPDAKPGGRPRAHATRELLNAIFYVLRGGCPWRLLPHDFFLPWQRDRLPLLQCVAYRRYLAAHTHHPSREAAPPGGPRAYSQRRHHRLPNGQDHRARRSPGLRRWQEDER